MKMKQRRTAYLLDDDEINSLLLKANLEKSGYDCHWFSEIERMFDSLKDEKSVDVFILDYDLGGKKESGLDACRRVKSEYRKPVVMLTGDRSSPTVLACMAVGADLYIEKPYEFDQFLAKVSAIIRLYARMPETSEMNAVSSNPLLEVLSCNAGARELSNRAGSVVSLTEKEMAFYEIICANAGSHVSREEVYTGIYGRQMDPMSRIVDNLACRVRAKLQKLKVPVDIQVIRGVGYRVVALVTDRAQQEA